MDKYLYLLPYLPYALLGLWWLTLVYRTPKAWIWLTIGFALFGSMGYVLSEAVAAPWWGKTIGVVLFVILFDPAIYKYDSDNTSNDDGGGLRELGDRWFEDDLFDDLEDEPSEEDLREWDDSDEFADEDATKR